MPPVPSTDSTWKRRPMRVPGAIPVAVSRLSSATAVSSPAAPPGVRAPWLAVKRAARSAVST